MVAKSFPPKQAKTKKVKNFLVEIFLWLQNHILGYRFQSKIFMKNFWSKIFMVEKSFPRKQVSINNFLENFLVEKFNGCKIISSELCLNKKFSLNIFWSIIFYGCKIISLGIGLNQNFSPKFSPRKFLWLQNHFL